jgi:hypothetical protein
VTMLFKCSRCGATFVSADELRAHLRGHETSEPVEAGQPDAPQTGLGQAARSSGHKLARARPRWAARVTLASDGETIAGPHDTDIQTDGVDSKVRPGRADTETGLPASAGQAARGRHIATAVVAIGLMAAALVFSSTIGRELRALRLLPAPAGVTELYFTSPSSLPRRCVVGEPQDISFTVHNATHRTIKYTYSISERRSLDSGGTLLASGNFYLLAGAYRHESARVLMHHPARRAALVVSLASPVQSIYFWIAVTRGSAPRRSD